MNAIVNWIKSEWPAVLIPVLVFVVILIFTFWLRKLAYDYLRNSLSRSRWKANEKIIQVFRGPSALWCISLSVYLALLISKIPWTGKYYISLTMWTLLLISFAIPLLAFVSQTIMFYGRALNMKSSAILFFRGMARTVILVIVVLVALDIWGAPVRPILLVVIVAALGLILAFRENFPDFFAGIQLGASQQIKEGDYIKLDTGEAGHVTEIGWNNTLMQTLESNSIIVPNSRLLQRTVINYGQPLKKALEPFLFNTRKIIKEPTGIKAKNLFELAEKIKTLPNDVIYCHTYRCLEENPYRAIEAPNDFAAWARDVLGDLVLSDKLTRVHILGFTNLDFLRENLIAAIQDHIAKGYTMVNVPEGKEFYFMKAVSIISPTAYAAHDMREFVEDLRKISQDSFYFHIFGSRVRLGNGNNDFSVWLERELKETDLAQEICLINPYSHTPEELRSTLIQCIEKRIK